MTNRVLMCTLSYNRQPFTKRLLETLFKGTDEPVDMIIVEQGSGEPAKNFCRQVDGKTTANGSTIKVIWNEDNVGIPKALNQALALRRPDQHFMKIDNDVILPDDCKHWLTAMVDIVENHKDNDPIEIIGLSPFSWERPLSEKGTLRDMTLKNGHVHNIEFWPHNILEMGMFIAAQVVNRVGNFNEQGLKYGYEGPWYQARANCSRAYFHTCHAIHGDNLGLLETHAHQALKTHILTGGPEFRYTVDKYSDDTSEIGIDFR